MTGTDQDPTQDQSHAEEIRTLRAALHWLRNHYDVGELNPLTKRTVLAVIDKILDQDPVTVDQRQKFAEEHIRRDSPCKTS